MTVARILAAKGGDVFTIQPHRTLAEVARLLTDKKIGAAVVAGADGLIAGIVSERDIVRAVANGGCAALDEPVTRHMSAKVATTTRSATVRSVMEQMTSGRFRHVPVIEHGRLAGLVSIGDVVKSHIEEIETEHQALREYIASA